MRDFMSTGIDEAKEVLGGYAVPKPPSQGAAIAIAAEFVRFHTDNGMPEASTDIREIDVGYTF